MSDRPWSPGPWKFDRGFINPNQRDRIYLIPPHECIANEKLASKSPEFAELLIKWTENYYLSDPDQFDRDVTYLLAEVGYNVEHQCDIGGIKVAIIIDMDSKCGACGKKGTLPNGLCIKCVHKIIKGEVKRER